MSDFAELRALAAQLTADIETAGLQPADLPSVKHKGSPASFINEVDARLQALFPGHVLTKEEERFLNYIFVRNGPLSADAAAERLAWVANGPNAFYWGPWLPYQDP